MTSSDAGFGLTGGHSLHRAGEHLARAIGEGCLRANQCRTRRNAKDLLSGTIWRHVAW